MFSRISPGWNHVYFICRRAGFFLGAWDYGLRYLRSQESPRWAFVFVLAAAVAIGACAPCPANTLLGARASKLWSVVCSLWGLSRGNSQRLWCSNDQRVCCAYINITRKSLADYCCAIHKRIHPCSYEHCCRSITFLCRRVTSRLQCNSLQINHNRTNPTVNTLERSDDYTAFRVPDTLCLINSALQTVQCNKCVYVHVWCYYFLAQITLSW